MDFYSDRTSVFTFVSFLLLLSIRAAFFGIKQFQRTRTCWSGTDKQLYGPFEQNAMLWMTSLWNRKPSLRKDTIFLLTNTQSTKSTISALWILSFSTSIFSFSWRYYSIACPFHMTSLVALAIPFFCSLPCLHDRHWKCLWRYSKGHVRRSAAKSIATAERALQE